MTSTTSDSTQLRSIVRTVLAVARLGEADRLGWWASHAFGAAGRVVLAQRMPSTWRLAAIELDISAAANRHDEVIARPDVVHLFSNRWPVRRWVSAWVAEQKTVEEPDEMVSWLETATRDDLVAAVQVPEAPGGDQVGPAIRLGTIEVGEDPRPEDLLTSVRQLGNAYAAMGSSLRVPFFEVEM